MEKKETTLEMVVKSMITRCMKERLPIEEVIITAMNFHRNTDTADVEASLSYAMDEVLACYGGALIEYQCLPYHLDD